MSAGEIRVLLEQPLIARIATNGPKGYPSVSPVWFLASKRGIIVDAYRDSAKVRNLKRDNRASILLDSSQGGMKVKGALFQGRATIIEGPDNIRVEEAIFEKYLNADLIDDDPVSSFYRRSAGTNPDDIILIELLPEMISSWDYTKITVEGLKSLSGPLTTRLKPEDIFTRSL